MTLSAKKMSLVELMAAVAVMGVLSAMAVQGWSAYTTRSAVYAASEAITSQLNLCRRMATDLGRPCSLTFTDVDDDMNGPEAVPGSLGSEMSALDDGQRLHLPNSTLTFALLGSTNGGVHGTQCWDVLPRSQDGACEDVMARPGWSGVTPGVGRHSLVGRVSVLGYGGAVHTSRLGYSPEYGSGTGGRGGNSAVAFSPEGRLLNPPEDFGCDGKIHIWVGDWLAWRDQHTKNYVQIGISRTGRITLDKGSSTTIDPYDSSDLHDASSNACPS